MISKSMIVVFAIIYITVFSDDHKHSHVSQAKKYADDSRQVKPREPTFRDLPIGKLFKKNQPVFSGTTRAGYLKLVNQVQRFNVSTGKLKRKIVSQNKTIFYQGFMLKRSEKEIKRQRDKIRTYKAQIRSFQLKLIDRGLITDVSLVSEERKGSKKARNLTEELYEDLPKDLDSQNSTTLE